MVNDKYKSLNKLYLLLLVKPFNKLSDLELTLNASKPELLSYLKALESMGLDLLYENEKVKIKHSIDTIELDVLKENLKSHSINKPIQYHFTTTSTNHLAVNNKVPSLYICDHQSQGKGRQNKTWVTPLGQSVALSISHAFDCGLSDISGLSTVIGVAIIKTIEQLGGQGMGLKWPNDIIGKNGKIAGILIEASGNTKSCFVVIGIGLNWSVRQSILEKVDKKCMNVGLKNISRTRFIAALIINVSQLIQEFSQNKLENIIPIWKKYDCYTGKAIDVIQDKKTKVAKYLGINSQGYLLVEMQGKTKLLSSGEVTIRKTEDKPKG